MAANQSTKFTGIEDILKDTAEVQLATFNAGIEFWSQWIKQTEHLSRALEKQLESIQQNPEKQVNILMEMTEVNREYFREVNNLPKAAAKKFIAELDRLQKKRTTSKSRTSPKSARRAKVKI